jgi:hypothetical protein
MPMTTEPPPREEPPAGLVLYTSPDGSARLQLRIDQGTQWWTKGQMAAIFQTTKQNISLHIRHVFAECELRPETTIKKYLRVHNEGCRTVKRLLDHYSLDVVIAVGFRVRSTRGTKFRQWATARLREYLTKGFAIDDERLMAGAGLGADYFDEMAALNRVVTMYLDYAEDQAVRQRPMHMADWVQKLDAFLEFNERNILSHAGRVSAEMARQHAEHEFAKHEATLRIREAAEPTSDFDKAVERIKRLEQQPPTAKRPPSKRVKKAKRKRPGSRGRSDES